MARHDLKEIRSSHESAPGLPSHPVHSAVCTCAWTSGWHDYVSEARAEHGQHQAEQRRWDDASQ
jgi:hypothetical protein